MISPRVILLTIGLGAGMANAVLSKGALCEYNSTPIGEYCASGLACVRTDLWGSGYCQAYKCPTVNAPEATITVAPATVTAAEATSTVYVTSTTYDLCLCPPTLIYTTTVTRAGFAAAAPTATVAAGGICANNSACAEGLSCVPSANGASRCFKAACVDDKLATKTITEQSTITAAPLAVTTTATVTTKVKTGSVTCSCLPGAQTTTITYTVRPKETGA